MEIGNKCQNSNKFLGFSVKRHDQETVMAAAPEDLSYAVQCDLALPSYTRLCKYILMGLQRKTRTLHFYSKYLKTQVIYLKKSLNTIQVMNSRRRILPTRLSRRNTRQLVKTDDIQGNKVKIFCFLNPQTLEKTLKFLVVRSSFHVHA